MVRAATSVTVLPCKEEAEASHDGVVPLIRKLVTIAVEKSIVKNVEHSQYHSYWDLLHQLRVDVS